MIREISIPEEWKNAVHSLERGRCIAIILGMPDVGKSTFAKYLTSYLSAKRIKVGLVDADIGQSFLGPPATIGLALFSPEQNHLVHNLEKILPHSLFFVGSTSPEGHFHEQTEGVKRMVEAALKAGSEVVIVDTTGLVTGEAGKELKRRKIELLSPSHIFALQRGHEIEHILTLYKDNRNISIQRLPISEMARSRSREERRAYRNNRFKEYFRDSEVQEISVKDIRITGKVLIQRLVLGQSYFISPERAIGIKGLLIGLKDEKEYILSLGVIDRFEKERLYVCTTLKEIERVRVVQLGSLKLNSAFEEEIF